MYLHILEFELIQYMYLNIYNIEIVSAIMLVGTAATAVNKVAYGWNPDGNSASPFSPGKKGNGVPPGQEAKIIGPDAPLL